MNVKSWLKKRGVAALGRFHAGGSEDRVVVLCYHSVHPAKSFASASPALFEQHLQWLRDHCELIPFGQTGEAGRTHKGKRPAVAITLDDGHADNYEYAFPLLKTYGVPATFFVTTGLLEKDPAVIKRFMLLRQADYEAVRPMDWAHVREMHREGMYIGDHSYSHPNLSKLDYSSAAAELKHSKELLEDKLGAQVSSMAYPFGKPKRHFTQETVRIVAEMGYAQAAAVAFRAVQARDSHLAIPRFFVAQDSVQNLKDKIEGLWDILGLWHEKLPLAVARVVSPLDFKV